MTWRRGLRVGMQVAVWVLVLGLTIALVMSGDVAGAFAELDATTAAWFVAFAGLSRVLAGLRWGRLARAHLGLTAGWFAYVRLTLLGEFANVWLPSFVGGEGAKALKLRAEGQPMGPTVASLVIDRVMAAISLLALCAPFVPSMFAHTGNLDATGRVVLSALAFAVFGGLVVAVALWFTRARLARRFAWMPDVSGKAVLENGVLGIPSHVTITLAYVPLLWPHLGWWEISALILVSRIGRVVPLQALGVNSVEGLTVLLGVMYGLPNELALVAVALNVGSKYVWSIAGAVLELVAGGTAFFKSLVRTEEVPT